MKNGQAATVSPAPQTSDQSESQAERRRRLARQRRDGWFMLAVLAVGVLTAFILSGGGLGFPTRGGNSSSHPAATTGTASSAINLPTGQTNGNLPPGVVAAQVRAWGLAPDNVGLMQPAVDSHGNIWFGEMATNRLGRLNPTTGTVSTWAPPNGRYNIMATAVDAHGDIWFTEQAGNYIGRFNPTTEKFTTYPLDNSSGHGVAPQDLTFDAAGTLWFTEITGGKIGRLNPATGAIQTWAVPASSNGVQVYPFCLTVLDNGHVWFGELTGGNIGRLDPTSGHVQLYPLADASTQVYSMAADKQGRVWFTELQGGKLGMMDTQTGKLTEITVSTTAGDTSGLYATVVSPNGDVWFACSGDNSLIRYTPQSGAFTFYRLGIAQSIPFGMALDASGTLWFTADGSPTNYVGQMHI